jgi:hypothetical protein
MKKPTKKTYTITEAAKKKGVTRAAIHLAIQKGTLKARAKKVTKVEWLISANDLDSYHPSGRHQASGKKITDA